MLWLSIGNQGSGKTVFLVSEAKKDYDKGIQIYSNIHLKFPYKRLNYKDIIECKYNNCTIVLDEIHLLLGSRASMSKKNNIITSAFCSQLRKNNIRLLGSTQRIGKVDRRIRDELTFLVECDRYVYQDNTLKYKAYDDGTTTRNTPTVIKAKVTDINTLKTVNVYFYANEYFKMYDTREIVIVEGLDEYFENEKQKIKESRKANKNV